MSSRAASSSNHESLTLPRVPGKIFWNQWAFRKFYPINEVHARRGWLLLPRSSASSYPLPYYPIVRVQPRTRCPLRAVYVRPRPCTASVRASVRDMRTVQRTDARSRNGNGSLRTDASKTRSPRPYAEDYAIKKRPYAKNRVRTRKRALHSCERARADNPPGVVADRVRDDKDVIAPRLVRFHRLGGQRGDDINRPRLRSREPLRLPVGDPIDGEPVAVGELNLPDDDPLFPSSGDARTRDNDSVLPHEEDELVGGEIHNLHGRTPFLQRTITRIITSSSWS